MNLNTHSFLFQLATLGPLGRKFPAPGTIGSIFGILFFSLLNVLFELEIRTIVAVSLPLILIGIPICTHAERILKETDPKSVIWDEFSVIPLIFIFLEDSSLHTSNTHFLFWTISGLLLFRALDILKPLGINKLQNLPSGLGVMTDDIAAALISAAVLGVLQTFPLSFL